MNKPAITEGIGFIHYSWPELGLRVLAERYTDDGNTELRFYKKDSADERLLHTTRVNLMSTQTMNSLVKRLGENSDVKEWTDILTYITGKTMEIIRRGEPEVRIGKKPETMKVEYQLAPILEKNQPTTIYSPGGYLKSYLAAYIACLVQFNVAGITDYNSCWMPTAGNVLYLDWESSETDHNRRVWAIKQGLGIDTEETLLYRFCSQPLVSDIHNIQRLVADNDIQLVIIDSQMAAAGYGLDPAQVASQHFNAVRSLRCTSLTLDHSSKAEWSKSIDSDNSTGPYGSVVKFNRSRSQYEIKKSQTAGDNFVELAIVHRKHNEGKLLKPIGLRIDFNSDANGDLEKVTFSSCDIANNPELSKSRTTKDRITDILKKGGMTVKEIAEELDKPETTIRMELNRDANKGIFVKRDNKWGLLASGYE